MRVHAAVRRDWSRCIASTKNPVSACLAFPCDQFGHQEPGNEAEIKQFCSTKYEVTFPMFAKIDVNGPRRIRFISF